MSSAPPITEPTIQLELAPRNGLPHGRPNTTSISNNTNAIPITTLPRQKLSECTYERHFAMRELTASDGLAL